MEAKRLGLSTLSTSLDQFPSTFVKNAFKPLASLAQRSNLRNKQYQTVIHWAARREFSEFMHDYYGGTLGRDELPTSPKDSGKHPWNEHLLIDLCKIRINCIGFADKYYVERWIRAIATGISVSPEAFLRDSLTYPPDVVKNIWMIPMWTPPNKRTWWKKPMMSSSRRCSNMMITMIRSTYYEQEHADSTCRIQINNCCF
jgi:hypothetical protein